MHALIKSKGILISLPIFIVYNGHVINPLLMQIYIVIEKKMY